MSGVNQAATRPAGRDRGQGPADGAAAGAAWVRALKDLPMRPVPSDSAMVQGQREIADDDCSLVRECFCRLSGRWVLSSHRPSEPMPRPRLVTL